MTVTFDLPPAGTLRPNDAHDPRTGTPEYKVCAVRVEPL